MAKKMSHSLISDHLVCERRTYYGSTLNLTKTGLSDGINRGNLLHKVMEVYLTEGLSLIHI